MAHVLIVEDSKSVATAHAYSLWELGHTVTFAYSAREARDYFLTTHHDVVLLDFDLPDGTGLEVFRTLQQVDPTVCVIMVTGKGNECLAAQILKEGAKDYLTKSSELMNLLPEVVDRVLKERAIQLQLQIKEQEITEAHGALEQKVKELAATNEQLQVEIDKRIMTAKELEAANAKLENTLEELGRSQAHMLQSEKMASMGQLAAGVAHEINNPTGFISSNLFTLATYIDEITQVVNAFKTLCNQMQQSDYTNGLPDALKQLCHSANDLECKLDLNFILEDAKSLIKESQDGAQRIKNIVADLKDFAHPGKVDLEDVNINDNIESAINLVWHEIKYKAEINKVFENLPLTQCFPQMIGQVFMNLLINASQAIEKEGIITIRTRAEEKWVTIQVEDTGKGISPENVHKIFDPFFTTKAVGQGTGLGLKVVYDIIQRHNGQIEVQSTPDVGTQFTIRLPIDGPDQIQK